MKEDRVFELIVWYIIAVFVFGPIGLAWFMGWNGPLMLWLMTFPAALFLATIFWPPFRNKI